MTIQQSRPDISEEWQEGCKCKYLFCIVSSFDKVDSFQSPFCQVEALEIGMNEVAS